jgi:hypothetical protein
MRRIIAAWTSGPAGGFREISKKSWIYIDPEAAGGVLNASFTLPRKRRIRCGSA